MSASKRLLVSVVAFTSVALLSREALAGCPLAADQASFRLALRDTMSCAHRRLLGGACSAVAPPACGAEEFQRILDLVGGMPMTPEAIGPALHCQAAVYRGARKFVARRMQERLAGRTRQKASRVAIRLADRCNVAITPSASSSLPRLGDRCESLTLPPADVLDGLAAQRCLRPALEAIVSDLLDLPPVPPNVVLIVDDDQHPEGINLMPDLLDLADRGVSFPNAFTTTPLCAPSRAGILTGQHAPAHGVTGNNGLPFHHDSTLATWFQAAGYRTALLGKYLNNAANMSLAVPPGWDEWRTFAKDGLNFFDYEMNENGVIRAYGNAASDYSTDMLAQHALRFVGDNTNQPFFLYFAPFAPHGPSTPAPRHAGVLAWLPPWRPANWYEDISDKPGWFRAIATNSLDALTAHDSKVREQRESLLAVDEAIGALAERLERLGMADNTIIVFTADHGLGWGEHRWLGKQVPYEEAIRIPLVLTYPLAITGGAAPEGFALNIDIAPTLIALTGIAPGHAPDGRSLTELLAGAADWRTDFVAQHFAGGFAVPPWDMVRTEQHKFVRHPSAIEELYDLAADPYEMHNGASVPENAALVAALEARLDELLQ